MKKIANAGKLLLVYLLNITADWLSMRILIATLLSIYSFSAWSMSCYDQTVFANNTDKTILKKITRNEAHPKNKVGSCYLKWFNEAGHWEYPLHGGFTATDDARGVIPGHNYPPPVWNGSPKHWTLYKDNGNTEVTSYEKNEMLSNIRNALRNCDCKDGK